MRFVMLALLLAAWLYTVHGWVTYRRVRRDTAKAIQAYEYVAPAAHRADEPEPIPPQAA